MTLHHHEVKRPRLNEKSRINAALGMVEKLQNYFLIVTMDISALTSELNCSAFPEVNSGVTI